MSQVIPSIGEDDILLIGEVVSALWKPNTHMNHLHIEPWFRKKATAKVFRDQCLIILTGEHRGKCYRCYSFEMSGKIMRINTSNKPLFEPFVPFIVGAINRSYTSTQPDDFKFLDEYAIKLQQQRGGVRTVEQGVAVADLPPATIPTTPKSAPPPVAPQASVSTAPTLQPPPSGQMYATETAKVTRGAAIALKEDQVYAVIENGKIVTARRIMAVTHETVFRELGFEIINKPSWQIQDENEPKKIKRQKQPATVGTQVFLNWIANTKAVLVEDQQVIAQLEMIGS